MVGRVVFSSADCFFRLACQCSWQAKKAGRITVRGARLKKEIKKIAQGAMGHV